MTEVGKYGKEIGVMRARDIKRIPAEPERATPKRGAKRAELKPYGISYRYNDYYGFLRFRKPHHKWFKTKSARDQSIACMRREEHGGRPFYGELTVIDP
jgi:hypothetical protein